jgi:hypothetical protein
MDCVDGSLRGRVVHVLWAGVSGTVVWDMSCFFRDTLAGVDWSRGWLNVRSPLRYREGVGGGSIEFGGEVRLL